MIKAIETEYNGYRFRSRLEARWAVFFDACGVDWEYESEGFDFGNGVMYLPDFCIHDVQIGKANPIKGIDVYVEVKGQMNDRDAEKIRMLYRSGKGEEWCDISETPVLVVGNIPKGTNMSRIIDDIADKACRCESGVIMWPNCYNFETIDGDFYAAIPGVDDFGTFTLFGGDYTDTLDEEVTERAYRKARQARFEFGETPTLKARTSNRETNRVSPEEWSETITRAKEVLGIDLSAFGGRA